MRRSWLWHTSEYLMQTWRVILPQSNSNCCSLKAAFYHKVPFSHLSFYLKGIHFERHYFVSLLDSKCCPHRGDRLALCWKELPLPTAESFPGWLWETGKGGPTARCGEPMLWQRVGSQLSRTFFPSPCCYPRTQSWLKQKAGSCQSGQKGKLSAKAFYFGSVLPNHFEFSLCKMWDVVVHIQIQCGFWSLMAVPWDTSLSQLWPTQGLTTLPLPSSQG